MQVEFHYNGESKTKSLLKKCTMNDVLSAFESLFIVESKNGLKKEELFINNDGVLTVLEDPDKQLFDGAVVENKRIKKEITKEKKESIENALNSKEPLLEKKEEKIENKEEVKNPEESKKDEIEKKESVEVRECEVKEQKLNNNNTTKVNAESVRYVVRLRGLPWSARELEITQFFQTEQISEIQIVYLTDGRASGEALVEFSDLKSFECGLLRNRHHIGHRYIEIFKSTGVEMDTAAGRISKPPATPPKSLYVIRMRGLPYSATDDDVNAFFKIPVPTGIHLIKDDLGRPSGEGFVEFKTEVDAIAAMAKHRHHMTHRYIELFRSSPEELMRALGLTCYQPQQSHKYNKQRQLQNTPKSTCILMRGLPYSCTESDITKFFQEIDVTPIRIHRKADGAEAYVEFYNIGDTDKAMTRHRNYIGRRYIELFRVTYEDMARTVGLPVPNTNIPASALSLHHTQKTESIQPPQTHQIHNNYMPQPTNYYLYATPNLSAPQQPLNNYALQPPPPSMQQTQYYYPTPSPSNMHHAHYQQYQ